MIKRTRNYKRFKLIVGDRPVEPARVNALVREIQQANRLSEFPIIVYRDRGKLRVADGQKRFHAAQRLKLPVFYVERSEPVTPDQIARHHRMQDKWSLRAYLESFVARGKGDYCRLREFVERYRLPLSISVELLGGSLLGRSRVADFRAGLFTVKDERFAMLVASTLHDLRADISFSPDRALVVALARVAASPRFDAARFLTKAAKQSWKIVKCSSWQQYAEIIEDIFNYRVALNEAVPLAFEAKCATRFAERRRAA
jgi:hypothetical protein